jgi:hypothetical protein
MPFGRGLGRAWFGGWGGGWGRGFGRGWGNPYPFCRNFPWLPRWWWATPYVGHYASTIPYTGYGYGAGHPYGPYLW